jgi:hypothetical protein
MTAIATTTETEILWSFWDATIAFRKLSVLPGRGGQSQSSQRDEAQSQIAGRLRTLDGAGCNLFGMVLKNL